jgi:uncharacterized membrane protein YdjX (TVP38/TMEM64 family)
LAPRARALARLAILPIVVIAAVLLAWKLGYFELDRRRQFVETVQRLRMVPLIEPAFVAAFAIAVAICLPVSILNLLGGAIFGPFFGALLSWSGAMVGTIFTHVLARWIANAPLRRLFREHRLLKQIKEHDNTVALFRLRVLPVAPFGVLDYIAGLANVSLKRLLIATALGVLPSVIAYSYVGKELLSGLVTGGEATRRGLWIAGAVTVGMMLISVGPGLVRRLRR